MKVMTNSSDVKGALEINAMGTGNEKGELMLTF